MAADFFHPPQPGRIMKHWSEAEETDPWYPPQTTTLRPDMAATEANDTRVGMGDVR